MNDLASSRRPETIDQGQQRPYAGDMLSPGAWKCLAEDPTAVLIDVRTQAEWVYVGVPDLAPLGKTAVFAEWQRFPEMDRNPAFAQQVAAAGITSDQTVLLICRSSARSAHAAAQLTTLGYARCFNVVDGFEGGLDQSSHRGRLGGWKAADLPWKQG
jgi:rhodanese-related sulfurtransferase